MGFNAAAAYQNSKIMTATGADLTLMLYDGAIKFCNLALNAMEKNDIQETNANIQKAEKIINELQVTLDYKYSVAEDFNNVYKYIRGKLFQANIKKDPEMLNLALNEIRDMRNIWKNVMAHNKSK